jgi:uncharacterized protein YqgC (DUF456 family)
LDSIIFALAQVFMLVGLFGLLVPVFPGLLVMWLAALVYGLATGFSTLAIVLFIFITLLTLAGSVVDNILMGAGARQGGASWKTIALGYAAGLLGTLFFPPFGGLIAAPLAVLLLHYIQTNDWKQSWGTLKSLAVGWGLSFFARFGIGLLLMLFWWLWVWQG